MTDESKPTHPPTHPEGGGTDERRGAAERKADEVLSETLDKYHEAVSSAHELQQRLDEAFAHLQDCHRAYLRASGVPEERIDKTDLMWELITEVDVQRAADQSKPSRTEGGTDKRRSAAERKADEVLSEARREYREALAKVAELRERRAETCKHVDACRRAYRRAWGFSEKMMDETDLMAALIEEVDAKREAEEAKKNENESKTEK